MATEIIVPELGESVVEATVGSWLKNIGDTVEIGDLLVELETDKVDLEVNAQANGVLTEIIAGADEDVKIGDVLGIISGDGAAAPAPAATKPAAAPAPTPTAPTSGTANNATPVAKRVAEAEGVNIADVNGTGRGGKITKEDVVAAKAPAPQPVATPAPVAAPSAPVSAAATNALASIFGDRTEREERVKMSRRRRTIAKRLVEVQQTAAMLTTFNEIDMSAVMDLRKRRKVQFQEKTGSKLGYTSFFTKAVVGALKAFPRLNAEIEDDHMVLKNYYDVGIAVGAEEGLVVPVLRDADKMTFAEIESQVRKFAIASREGSLSLSDLMGGTFTITNGGIFGSMLSTPILNPPQVGILGLHNIVERPIAIDGEVVIRPIMYVALSYDHRIVDGREAVQFLYRIKELIEDPEELLLAG